MLVLSLRAQLWNNAATLLQDDGESAVWMCRLGHRRWRQAQTQAMARIHFQPLPCQQAETRLGNPLNYDCVIM